MIGLLRIRRAELMDDPNLDPLLHNQALRGLANLNFLSFAGSQIWQQLVNFSQHKRSQTIRVLDLATGGGYIPLLLAKKAERANIKFEFVGADISANAIQFARNKAKILSLPVSFIELDVLNEKFPSDFDVIMTSLFTHHLDPEQVVDLLIKMRSATKHVILVNDLIRSPLSLAIVSLASKILSTSIIVHHDGPASVRAAYTVKEMLDMAERAGLDNSVSHQSFLCRQILFWKKSI